jgi:hypothetical protein
MLKDRKLHVEFVIQDLSPSEELSERAVLISGGPSYSSGFGRASLVGDYFSVPLIELFR